MDIEIQIRIGRKVIPEAGPDKWKDYETKVVSGGEELGGLVEYIMGFQAMQVQKADEAIREQERALRTAQEEVIHQEAVTARKIERKAEIAEERAEARAEEKAERKAEDKAEAKKLEVKKGKK